MFGAVTGEANRLIKDDVSTLRRRVILDDFVGSIVFESGNEEDTGLVPPVEEFKIIVPTVNRDDTAGGKREVTCGGDVGGLAVGDYGEVWQIAVMVQQQV